MFIHLFRGTVCVVAFIVLNGTLNITESIVWGIMLFLKRVTYCLELTKLNINKAILELNVGYF